MKRTHYEILGISSESTVDRIRRAYLDKVRLVHPDINPSADAHKEFILLKEAYDTLMNENKRMAYDMKIRQAATTKQNIVNFHYDFKSNLSGSSIPSSSSDPKVALILILLAALMAGGVFFFFSNK